MGWQGHEGIDQNAAATAVGEEIRLVTHYAAHSPQLPVDFAQEASEQRIPNKEPPTPPSWNADTPFLVLIPPAVDIDCIVVNYQRAKELRGIFKIIQSPNH